MTSLQLAELTGKQHKHTLRAIRRLLVKLDIDEDTLKRYDKDYFNRPRTYLELDSELTSKMLEKFNTGNIEETKKAIAIDTIEQMFDIELIRDYQLGLHVVDAYDEDNNTIYEFHKEPLTDPVSRKLASRRKDYFNDLECTMETIYIN